MAFTWGFIVLFFFVIFPGLIIRRLYFYGEFSKQYSAGQPLVKIVFYAIIPGLFNTYLAFLTYEYFIESIDIGAVIDTYKELASDQTTFTSKPGVPIKESILSQLMPFTGLVYLNAFLFGNISGRLVNKLGLDGYFRVLKFKNQWYYLLNGHHGKLQKFKRLKTKNKFLFAKADVLVDTEDGTKLYSGKLVDYELSEKEPSNISRVYLQEAKRYKKTEKASEAKEIPGHLLIVDCKNLVNLNLTFIYEKYQSGKRPSLKQIVYYIPTVVNLLLIPTYFYKFKFIEISHYDYLFEMTYVGRIFAYFLVSQIINLPQLLKEVDGKYHLLSPKEHGYKIILVIVTYGLMLFVDWFGSLILSIF
ncbi:MAG: hypothetical protein ACPGLV_02765 [Bacteroidia bacterium]